MRICVFNLKGGVGKSVISINLALTMKYYMVTNEPYGMMEKIFPKNQFHRIDFEAKQLANLPSHDNIIFDLGGFLDENAADVLREADCVIIPVVYGTRDDIQVSINSINEIRSINPNILIIANRVRTRSLDKIRIKKIFKELYRYPILEIKQSAALKAVYDYKASIHEIASGGGVIGYHYRFVADQFDKIIKHMERNYAA